MRLAKYLAMAGVASRRQAEDLIRAGQVKVNGLVVDTPAINIDPEQDEIWFDGQLQRPEQMTYLLLFKPVGYISSVYDPQGRPTVMELVKEIGQRIYPVGRLDLDTEGLLLMSNDGEFANLMIHPRYEMSKTYEALVEGKVGEKDLVQLKQGVLLEDGVTAPAQAQVIRQQSDQTLLQIEIHEGRKRQVRRMCAAIGHPVVHLKRVAFSGLTLTGLQPGQYRRLTAREKEELLQKATMALLPEPCNSSEG